jgi:predicted transcriptional regulator
MHERVSRESRHGTHECVRHAGLQATVQTTVYRLERKKVLRCVKRISNANIFEAAISRNDAQRIDELLALSGGRGKLVMTHLIEAGEITLDDLKEAEKALRKTSRKEPPR